MNYFKKKALWFLFFSFVFVQSCKQNESSKEFGKSIINTSIGYGGNERDGTIHTRFGLDLIKKYLEKIVGNVILAPMAFSAEINVLRLMYPKNAECVKSLEDTLPEDENVCKRIFASQDNGPFVMQTRAFISSRNRGSYMGKINDLKTKYNTELIEFKGVEDGREKIDTWLSELNKDKTVENKTVFGAVPDESILNASSIIYTYTSMDAPWEKPFKDLGGEQEFTIRSRDGQTQKTIHIPMMYLENVNLRKFSNGTLRAIELPYENGSKMMICVPIKGKTLEDVENYVVDFQNIANLFDKLRKKNFQNLASYKRFFMPKCKITHSASLTESLMDILPRYGNLAADVSRVKAPIGIKDRAADFLSIMRGVKKAKPEESKSQDEIPQLNEVCQDNMIELNLNETKAGTDVPTMSADMIPRDGFQKEDSINESFIAVIVDQEDEIHYIARFSDPRS